MIPGLLELIGVLGGSGLGALFGGPKQQKLTPEQRSLLIAQEAAQREQIAASQQEREFGAFKQQRREAQNPLFAALQQMAFRGLPTYAQQGINFELPQFQNTQPPQPPLPPGRRPRDDREITGYARSRGGF